MGYLHIDNLYNNQTIRYLRECYALEKVHGTSAHIHWRRGADTPVTLYSGGASAASFAALFDVDALGRAFAQHFAQNEVTVYGEAYGGKIQKMSHIYGTALAFVAFDVRVDDRFWLSVPDAHAAVDQLGLEFVPYILTSTDPDALIAARAMPSRIAERRGLGVQHGEGVVLRPLIELTDTFGNRVIAKYKRPEFSERASKRDASLDPVKAAAAAHADAVAAEWVTRMRLSHVIDGLKLGRPPVSTDTSAILSAMVTDVLRESKGEVAGSRDEVKAIKAETSRLLRAVFQERLTSVHE